MGIGVGDESAKPYYSPDSHQQITLHTGRQREREREHTSLRMVEEMNTALGM
jgi:hypothetical protein